MLTSWSPHPPETLTRRQLEKKAARSCRDRDIDLLVELGTLERADKGFVAMPNLEVGVELLDLDIPEDSMGAAGRRDPPAHGVAGGGADRASCARRCSSPTGASRTRPRTPRSCERTMARLRQLTLEAVVTGFQRAANDVITRSLAG